MSDIGRLVSRGMLMTITSAPSPPRRFWHRRPGPVLRYFDEILQVERARIDERRRRGDRKTWGAPRPLPGERDKPDGAIDPPRPPERPPGWGSPPSDPDDIRLVGAAPP